MKILFTRKRLDILSQLFVNLSAGWFGVLLIVPGVTRLGSIEDFSWLIRNLLFGILALLVSIRLKEVK